MRKNLIIVLILLGSISIGGYIYKKNNMQVVSGNAILNEQNSYDATEEIKQAVKLLNSNEKAEIITSVDSNKKVLALSFEGISDRATMNKIIEALDKSGIKATFFLPGIKAAEDPIIVEKLSESGHDIGSGTLTWKKDMENLSTEELVDDFCRTNKILKTITGKDVTLLKCNSTDYNDSLLKDAYAAGNKYVVEPNHYLSYQSFKNYEQAKEYIKNIKNGAIVSIKLEGVLDDKEYGKKYEDGKHATYRQAGLSQVNNKKEEEVPITQIVEWLVKALEEENENVVSISDLPTYKEDIKLEKLDNKINVNTNNKMLIKSSKSNEKKPLKNENNDDSFALIDFKGLIEKNNGKHVQEISNFYTTEESLAYTFRGISNDETVNKVLEELDKINAKGTFFVTKEEILKYPDRIYKILSKGHEIGNGGITTNLNLLNKSTEEVCKEIYEVDKLLKDRGISTNAYMPGYGYVDEQIQEALSVIKNIPGLEKYELFTYSKAPILNKYKDWKAEDIISNYFNINSYVSLRKGEIVYFRLDSEVFKEPDTIPNMLDIITKKYVENGYAHRYDENLKTYILSQKPLGYSIVTINKLQSTFETATLPGRYDISRNEIVINKKTEAAAINMFKDHYIGNDSVDLSDFKANEQAVLDKGGVIDTKGESVVFFTFDDWGGDPEINELINVLNKHKVKASFFVIGRNVDVDSNMSNINPNLLRTIAVNGNDIGSHTYNHDLLAADPKELQASLIKSYSVMGKVIGDLNSLRPYFRPPTLLLRREGLLSVFETGYKYSISGNISTHDYESSSPQEVLNDIEQGLVKNKGNVVVMHMNDQAYYTAEAVDIFLTNNEKGLYGEKYKIAKLSDYLEK